MKYFNAKTVLICVALTMFLGIDISVSSANILTAEEQEYLKRKEVIHFISQTVYPPFEFLDKDGMHNGMCIEIARWIGIELGFKTRFTGTSFKEAQEAILNGEADVLTSLFYSVKRDKLFEFTQTTFQVPASIFVAADRPDIKSINDLNGKTIAMQKGDYAFEYLESQNIRFDIVYTENFAAAADLVIDKQADAVIGDEQIVLYHIYSHRLTNYIKKIGKPLYVGNNCMAVKEGNRILAGILDKGVALAKSNGVLDRINQKWLGTRYYMPESFWERHRLLLQIVPIAFIMILMLIWLWNIRLRKTVAQRTNALLRSKKTLQTILRASPVGIGVIRGNKFDWHNRAMNQMLNFTPEELTGKNMATLYPGKNKFYKTSEQIYRALQTSNSTSVETIWRRKDGSCFDCLINYAPVEKDGAQDMAIVVAEDISERKRIEAHIRSSLQEKETLLKEIHHRVKNNMQVVSSLLSLQAENIQGNNVTDALNIAQSRVQSMALVHEILYRSDSLSRIAIQDYLEQLVALLHQIFGAYTQNITVVINARSIELEIDHAVSCGLIFNELIINSFKYAFDPGQPGRVQIDLLHKNNHQIEMVIKDDGKGFSDDFVPSDATTLGMQLVTDLVERQLEGSWELVNNGGACWIIRWPYSA